MALAGTIFFGIGSVILIMGKRKPFLILNDDGISIPGHPHVLWNNIRDFQFKDVKAGGGTKTKFLCFFLYDTTVLVNKENRTFASKLASHFNETLLGTPIFVHMNSLSTSQEELTDLILAFKKNSETNRTH
jgi:tagatose-1,6-bisphosphate aldolase